MHSIYIINYLLSMTIALAAVTALLKWAKISKTERPIIIGWWIVILNETVRFVMISQKNYSFISYNIYPLPMMMLYIWQFKCWDTISTNFAKWLMIMLAILWVVDMFFLRDGSLHGRHLVFSFVLSVVIVLLSVTTINRLIVTEKKSLVRNHRFLICFGMTIFYTYYIFNVAFFLKGMSEAFLIQIGNLNRYVLQIYYLLLFLAVLWIPRKKNFILQF